ncbi:MAG TPA: metallophosphoesterase family protein [bacterium]|nr:metallophosphoesterase family protein [bacterium]
MRVAIISDVHGNVRALEAVLAAVRARGPFDEIVNGGDLALGGPRPREAMEALRALGYPTVVGNTDQWLVGGVDALEAPPPLHAVRDWARRRLGSEDLAYLRVLPMSHRIEPAGGPPLVIVHATPTSTMVSVNPDAPAEMLADMLAQAQTRALAYGHIHKAYVREVGDAVVVNVGSVGLPFDGVAKPAWAMLTLRDGRWQGEIVRVPYDTEAVARDLLQSDHPAAATFAGRVRTARAD